MPVPLKKTYRLLIVDDDVQLCVGLVRALAPRDASNEGPAFEVRCAHSLAQAREAMTWNPEFVLLDLRLGLESGIDFAREFSSRPPTPAIIATSGTDDSSEGFLLATLGVRSFLRKPFNASTLRTSLSAALTTAPEIEPLLAQVAGLVSLRELTDKVHEVLVAESMALAEGNKSRAARLLGVTRQAVQKLSQRWLG